MSPPRRRQAVKQPDSERRDLPRRTGTHPRSEPPAIIPRIQHSNGAVSVCSVQFGRVTRDKVYSVEFDRAYSGTLHFVSDRRQFHVRILLGNQELIITLEASQVSWASAQLGYDEHNSAVSFSLKYPPSYWTESILPSAASSPTATHRPYGPTFNSFRLSSLDPTHEAYSPFLSPVIRVVCPGGESFYTISAMLRLAGVPSGAVMHAIPRELLSLPQRETYHSWLKAEGFEMAFQLDSVVRANILDLPEILRLKPHLIKMRRTFGTSYTASFIRHLGLQAQNGEWLTKTDRGPVDPLMKLLVNSKKTFDAPSTIPYSDRELFFCHHVIVTPSRIILKGPFPERNNRVMRKYAAYTINFVRVSFADEDGLELRVGPSSSGRRFIQERFGRMLSRGLDIAEHHFDFLTYSQSGLKSHAFWFVRPFRMPHADGSLFEVTAASIISGLGTFDDPIPLYDPTLRFCPARYGARLAQAFTSTDAAVEVKSDELIIEEDIHDNHSRSFTDGAGLMSFELASDIWRELQRKNPRLRGGLRPDVLQIRYQGSKGTLTSAAHLTGRQMVLRHSMIKFSAPSIETVEVAAVFNHSAPFCLNRPFIMALEALKPKGGYVALKRLQDEAIDETKYAMQSFRAAARLFDRHGLGAAYKLASICTELAKLELMKPRTSCLRNPLNVANYHVIRDIKYRAHIPVPQGYTLVGVADPYATLDEGEVYACIASAHGDLKILEGDMMISRSPVIHPGDIQIVKAVRPPAGSLLEQFAPKNALVFSTKGSRPQASCHSGGDLDGDTFVVTMYSDLLPTEKCPPANCDPTARKINRHPCTMQDVANFAIEHIYSDNVGIIASRWLELADKSPKGVFSPACLALSKLHSAAVDYPKTGFPVPLHNMPKSSTNQRPDWSAPEVAMPGSSGSRYYQSQSFIGRLYREITLSPPDVFLSKDQEESSTVSSTSTLPTAPGGTPALLQRNEVEMRSPFESDDALETTIYSLVMHHIDAEEIVCDEEALVRIWSIFCNYTLKLREICVEFSLSQGRSSETMLSEDEIVAGTILAPASDSRLRRQRKEQISQMREQTSLLVDHFATSLREGFGANHNARLKYAWLGFRLTTIKRNAFGSSSFRLLALHEIFDITKSIDLST